MPFTCNWLTHIEFGFYEQSRDAILSCATIQCYISCVRSPSTRSFGISCRFVIISPDSAASLPSSFVSYIVDISPPFWLIRARRTFRVNFGNLLFILILVGISLYRWIADRVIRRDCPLKHSSDVSESGNKRKYVDVPFASDRPTCACATVCVRKTGETLVKCFSRVRERAKQRNEERASEPNGNETKNSS